MSQNNTYMHLIKITPIYTCSCNICGNFRALNYIVLKSKSVRFWFTVFKRNIKWHYQRVNLEILNIRRFFRVAQNLKKMGLIIWASHFLRFVKFLKQTISLIIQRYVFLRCEGDRKNAKIGSLQKITEHTGVFLYNLMFNF